MASVIDNIDTNTLKTIVMDTGDEVDVDDI